MDHSIQRHYDNFNDPQLLAQVQLAHLQIMHRFNIIELYEMWPRTFPPCNLLLNRV
jgi:hypothetical protein